LKRKDCGEIEGIGELSSVDLYKMEMVQEEEGCSYVTLESVRVDGKLKSNPVGTVI
jgi:hypothetical protein